MRKTVENLRPDSDQGTDSLMSRYGELWADSDPPREVFLERRFRERLARETAQKSSAAAPAKRTGTYPWLLAAACLLGLFIAFSNFNREIGAVVFSTGPLFIEGNSQGPTKLQAGTSVEVPTGAKAMLSLDEDRINLFLNQDTRLTFGGRDTLVLVRGEVWIRVEPDSGHFGVSTPHGVVEVHGTTFGITVTDTGAQVDIAAGKVAVTNDRGAVFIEPGQTANLSRDGDAPTLHSRSGDVTPRWARELFNEAALAREMTFFPSARRLPLSPEGQISGDAK